ncbi:hypothetical protein Acr_12g0006790 [Actinidia rufa]|uniref:Uncharacterized protein n=1 Tax=Actinidia rufa TaxID=165716 RepID=A0A7J0FHG1_9ERIC|nr:hypothetical protein Acr_12g0006790 [Actinidia rufa]
MGKFVRNQDVQPHVQKQWVVKSKGVVEPKKLIREEAQDTSPKILKKEPSEEAVILEESRGSPLAPQGVQLSDNGISGNFGGRMEESDPVEGVSKDLTLSPETLKGVTAMVIAPAASVIPVIAEGGNHRIKEVAITSGGHGPPLGKKKGRKAARKKYD